MPDESWIFGEYPGATEDHVNKAHYLYETIFRQSSLNLESAVGREKNVQTFVIQLRILGSINPADIVPKGPELNFMLPHGCSSK